MDMSKSTIPYTPEQAGPCVSPKDLCHVFPLIKCPAQGHVTFFWCQCVIPVRGHRSRGPNSLGTS